MNDIKVAVIMPLSGCNMFCNFCVTDDDFDCVSFEQAVSMLKYVGELGIKNVVFGGGEPFFWPHNIIRLCEKAKELGFIVQTGTNATKLPQGYEKLPCIDRFVIPVESADEKIHNSMRFFPNGHYSVVMDCLKRLRAKAKAVTVSTVVTNSNIAGLEGLADFLRGYDDGHIHAWHLYRFIPKGRGGLMNAAKLAPAFDAYASACENIKAMDLPFHVFKRADMYNSKTVEFFRMEKGIIRTSAEFSK